MTVRSALHRPLCPEGRAAAEGAASAVCAEAARPYVLAATILASAMAFIDGSVVTIALPAIQDELATDFQRLQWVVHGYTLMLGALLLVGGGLGDRIGRRRVFVAGLLLFTLASIACAAAPSIGVLIAGRVVQGIGAAALVPQSLAIIAASFPKEVRGAAIGTWAAASAVTTALGPPLGGFLIDSLSWRVAFWINIPLAAAAFWLTQRHVPESRNEQAGGAVDWGGAAVAVVSLGVLTLGLTMLSEQGGSRGLAYSCLAVGALGILPFLRLESRAENPVMPPALFRSPVFTGTNIVTLFLYGSLSGALFLLPFELIERRGLSATQVGLTLLPLGLIIGLFSRRAGAAADRVGPRPFLAVGALLVVLACAGLALNLSNFWLGVLLPVLLLAAGLATAVSPLTTAVMNSVPDAQSGAASGVNNAASRLAGLFSVAILGAVASLLFARAAPPQARFGVLPPLDDPARATLEGAFSTGYAAAMALAAVGAAAAAVCSFLLPRRAARPA
ncbi:MAG: MFS transporter [Thermoanaerobaculia bacterium]